MTRNNSAELTAAARQQYEALRRDMQRQLARRVLAIVGVRCIRGRPYVTTRDIWDREAELVTLLGHIKAYFTATERQRLYKNNEHLGSSVAKLALASVGHPLVRSPCRLDGQPTSKFSLDPSLC